MYIGLLPEPRSYHASTKRGTARRYAPGFDAARSRRRGISLNLPPIVEEVVAVVPNLDYESAGQLTLNVDVPLLRVRRPVPAVVGARSAWLSPCDPASTKWG